MSRIYIDSSLRTLMEEAERIRALTEPYSDAVREMQRQFEDRRELYRQFESIDQLFGSEAFRQLQRDLEQRREILGHIPMGSMTALQAAREHLDTMSDVLYRHREVIDPLVFATFSGGSSAPSLSGSFRKANRKLVKSYEKVSELPESETDAAIPPPLRALATAEAFTSAEVLEELGLRAGIELDEEEKKEREERRKIRRALGDEARERLEPSLAEVNPAFARIWKGALLALGSDNPERVRHFSASSRALIEHLLEHLAPEHEIVRWSTAPVKYLDGKPMRKEQLRYICRSLPKTSDFAQFAKNDIDEILATFYSYNRAVHGLEPSFTAEEINALETRTAQNLLFLLSFRSLPN